MKSPTSRSIVPASLLLLASVACVTPAPESPTVVAIARVPWSPATQDPLIFDLDAPPRMVETAFEVEGAALNAVVYEAQGPGPHPALVLLHGFPGFERNLDLAQAARRAGWTVVFFHYRGAWGSGGEFSFVNVIEDVHAVVEAIAQPDFASTHRLDPNRIALVGHSMGGFAALVAGAENDRVDCVASLAGANLGGFARAASDASGGAEQMAASLDSWSGPIVGPSGTELVAEVAANAERFETTGHATRLAGKSILLLAGGRDQVTTVTVHHTPLVEALEAAGAEDVTAHVMPLGDHAFSGLRIELATRLVDWLEGRCRAG
ncbi:MAG: alpha/beta fold hydrolase [bacterium]|nr:alpha/beta fold hydrolase [bacterium]